MSVIIKPVLRHQTRLEGGRTVTYRSYTFLEPEQDNPSYVLAISEGAEPWYVLIATKTPDGREFAVTPRRANQIAAAASLAAKKCDEMNGARRG